MNIFILDRDVRQCAEYHNNKHVVKMILETTQLLNNALVKNEPEYKPVYRQTHKNHPCSIWAGTCLENFEWLNNLGMALCNEYTYRYGKVHKCQSILMDFQKMKKSSFAKNGKRTPFALCMPEEYRTNDAVESYRNYYMGSKRDIALWNKRNVPEWWK